MPFRPSFAATPGALTVGGNLVVNGTSTSLNQLITAPGVAASSVALTMGTAFHNNATGYDIVISGVISVTTATAGATITFGVGSSPPSGITLCTLPTVAATILIPFSAYVPNAYYFELNTTGTIVVAGITAVQSAV
jgi:hypothetical protein